MTKTTQSLWMLGALAVALSTAPLFAQQSDPQSSNPPSASQQQQPDTQSPPPSQAQPPAGQSGNEAQGQQPADDGQTFSGTIAKSGDKYILQETSGKTYDVDHQEALKQYEGKKVRIKGSLDPDGKTIHIK